MSESLVTFDLDSAKKIANFVRREEKRPQRTDNPGSLHSGAKAPRACSVKVLSGVRDASGLYPGLFVYRNTTWQPWVVGDETQNCWLMYNGSAAAGQVYHALIVDYHTDGLPIALVSHGSNSTPDAVDTCEGECVWEWDTAVNKWKLASEGCDGPCLCQGPTDCDPDECSNPANVVRLRTPCSGAENVTPAAACIDWDGGSTPPPKCWMCSPLAPGSTVRACKERSQPVYPCSELPPGTEYACVCRNSQTGATQVRGSSGTCASCLDGRNFDEYEGPFRCSCAYNTKEECEDNCVTVHTSAGSP